VVNIHNAVILTPFFSRATPSLISSALLTNTDAHSLCRRKSGFDVKLERFSRFDIICWCLSVPTPEAAWCVDPSASRSTTSLEIRPRGLSANDVKKTPCISIVFDIGLPQSLERAASRIEEKLLFSGFNQMLGPKRSITGSGEPVPKRVTLIVCPCTWFKARKVKHIAKLNQPSENNH
jgi:hypothetical protein